jgi:Type II secretion system (T2SS), protein E, N-terminal domain
VSFLTQSSQRSREAQTALAQSAAAQPTPARAFMPRLLGQCANPGCDSSWLHLFRKRTTPIFESGWTCSPECTETQIRCAIQREMSGRVAASETHRHRIPLGLLMLEQGWIRREQLQKALEGQKATGTGRLGEWLIRQGATDEATVTRALGIQWSCPVLSIDSGVPRSLAALMPRLFLDAFGVLPLRVAAGKLLYLGFEQCLDPVFALAVERMMGLRVECGMVQSSDFRIAHESMLNEKFPSIQLGEAVTESATAHMLARALERAQPVASRIVRVRDCIWLRMHLSSDPASVPQLENVRDVVLSIEAV